MNKIIVFSLIILSVFVSCANNGKQGSTDMKDFLPDEINGWHLSDKVEVYDRESIFQYIDGAGEVYNSYGFTNVHVYRYINENGPDISVEIFDMGSDADAYGVFSYSRESELEGIGQGYELLGNLICFWEGKYYVCVRAEDRTDQTDLTIKNLSHRIDNNMPHSGNKPALLAKLPVHDLKPNSVRYLHTNSALNYHYYISADNVLDLDDKTNIILGEYGDKQSTMIMIEYPDSSRCREAYNNFVKNYMPELKDDQIIQIEEENWAAVYRESKTLILIMDAPSGDYATFLLDEVRSQFET